MIRVKGKALTYGEIWFDEEPPAHPGVDILEWRQQPAAAPGIPCKPVLSIVSDLSVAEQELTEPFINTCRYQIRRADTKDALRAEFIADPAGRLDEFHAYFNAFAKQRSIDPAGREWLESACRAGQLVLTSASCQNATLVWHAYLVCGEISWLMHSASSFREGNTEFRSFVGRANRWLHWRDMIAFKRSGKTCYDWGGMFMDESAPDRAGINNFKRSFGGSLVHRFDYVEPVTIRGRIYLPLRDACRRWSTRAQPLAVEAPA